MPEQPRHEIKQSAIERLFNGLMGTLVGFGIGPGYMRLLQVKGRKSGRIYSTPVNMIEVSGRRYLVAARGDTAWSRNARVSGEVTLKRGSSAERCSVQVVPEADRPVILKAFLDKYASQVQRFFTVQAGQPVEAFREMAPKAPVFELRTLGSGS